MALSVLAVLAAAIVYVVGSSGGGSSAGSAPVRGAGGEPSNGGGGSKLVHNATPQPDWTPHRGPVPILMYHVLGQPISGAPYPELFVPRAIFCEIVESRTVSGPAL